MGRTQRRAGGFPQIRKRAGVVATLSQVLAVVLGAGALIGLPLPVLAEERSEGTGTDRDGDQLRDAFEQRWHISSPDDPDTDHDGIRDAAEDTDHDRLSALGEQRYGTSPVDRDTDDDGTPDGLEDRDRDGRTDAQEQDSRPVPAHLVPSLGHAVRDLPRSMADGCHSLPYDPAIHPCVYGDRRGTTRIALFGDSHALQWLPALARSGERWGWRIVTLTKSACPSAHVVFQQPVFTHATPSCRAWRASGLRWLAAHPQDLVIFSNSHGYRVLNARGQRVRGTAKERVWERGLVAAIRDLPRSQRVLVLGDTPGNHADPPACLARHLTRISACVTGRRKALRASHDRTERSAASTTGATFASLSRQICPYDPCPVIVNELLIWRDRSHLTATYSRQLAPSMVALIRKVLAR